MPSRDPFVTPGVYRGLELYVKDLRVHLLAAGHWAQRSHPERIESLIREEIASVAELNSMQMKKSQGGAR